MAKIFRTEELSVNGDNIRISAEAGNLIFKDGSGNLVTSTDIRTQEVSSLAFKDGSLDTDVSSLKVEISDSVAAANTDLEADISSLQAQRTSDENTNDTEISSLQAQRVSDEATKTQEVSSLAFKDSSLDTDVSSLKADLDSDVSSVAADYNSDISSLHAQRTSDENTNDTEISSLHAQRVSDEATKTQEVSSLAFKDGELDTDVSSLKVEISDSVAAANTDLEADISSLQAQRTSDENTNDTEISSLQAQRVSDEATKTQEVSSLAFKDSSLDTDVSSLAALAAKNDVVVAEKQIWTSGVDPVDGVSSVTIDLGREFSTAPKVVGVLMTSVSTDPIVGFMLQSVGGGSGSNHTATFVFSDDIASANYKMQVLASI